MPTFGGSNNNGGNNILTLFICQEYLFNPQTRLRNRYSSFSTLQMKKLKLRCDVTAGRYYMHTLTTVLPADHKYVIQ